MPEHDNQPVLSFLSSSRQVACSLTCVQTGLKYTLRHTQFETAENPPVRTGLNEAGVVYVHVWLTPGPAASYKALPLSGTIKAPCGRPSFFLPLKISSDASKIP